MQHIHCFISVPYGPGEYYNAASDSAIMCGENEYQDEFGETSCKSCAGKASDDRTHCIGMFFKQISVTL